MLEFRKTLPKLSPCKIAAMKKKSLHQFLLIVLISFSIPVVGCKNEGDSSTGVSKGTNTNTGEKDPPGTINAKDEIFFGGIDCPVVVGGKSVFVTDTLERRGGLKLDRRFGAPSAVSRDGTQMAYASKSDSIKVVDLTLSLIHI